jgi:serine/threonine protein kinase
MSSKADISETAPGVTIRGAGADQRLFGRYTLKRVLGRGGMGIVWLAHDDELKRSVAMKFLPDMIVRDREAVEDLKRETRRSLDLTHHHIVRIYDFTQDENSAAIIMEYVDGETLSAMKTQQPGGCFGVSTLSIWAGHFCQALDYAHRQARVVHRDLKPANLMVNSRGDLKITDFGISRSMSDSMTRVSMSNTAGTLAYMSPEQALGSPPAGADDIYAFGATMYDLLTGRPPFFRGNLQVQLETVVPPPMNARRAELGNSGEPVPALWEEVIAACLAKRPQDRPQSMAEIANLLGIGGPTTGYRPGSSPTFAPLSAALAPGTTRATQQAQPATTPTQPTLSPDELVTQIQGRPGAGASSSSQAAVKPTSLRDVIPGYDFAREPERTPAAAVPSEPLPPPEVAEAAAVAEELPVEAPPEPEPLDDSFPTIVPQPPVVAESTASSADSQSSLPAVEDDHFPTLRGESIEQSSEQLASDAQDSLPVQEQESLPGNANDLGVTLIEAPISLPQEQIEEEFPTFAGTPLPEVVPPQTAAEIPSTVQPLGDVHPHVETTSTPPPSFTRHAFGAPPSQVPTYTPARKRSPLPMLLGAAAAVLIIGGAVWMAIPPKKEVTSGGGTPISIPPVDATPVPIPPPPPVPTPEELAQPFINEGRKLLASDRLDAAEEQARLALEKNPNDPEAVRLQGEIVNRRKAIEEAEITKRMAADRAEAERLVAEGNNLFPRDLKAARAKSQEALKKVQGFEPATVLLAKIEAREMKEAEFDEALKDARAAFNQKDLADADRALDKVPEEFKSRDEVIDLRSDISRERAAMAVVRKPTPKPRAAPETRPSSTAKRKEPTPRPKRRTVVEDDRPPPRPVVSNPPERPQRPPPTSRPSTREPRPKPPGTGGVIGG